MTRIQHYNDSKTYVVKSKKQDKFYTQGDVFSVKILHLQDTRIGVHTEVRSRHYTWRVFQSLEQFQEAFEILE